VVSETYPVATEHLLELIAQLMQCALRADSDTDESTRSVSCLCKAANRLEMHLLTRFSRSPEPLRALISALEEHSATLFGAHNAETQMIMLIAHALFEHGFFQTDAAISASSMRVFARILSARRAVLLPLLSYQDNTGTPRSLLPDGFDKLLDKDGNPTDDLRAFCEWITGAKDLAPGGKDSKDGRMRMPQAALEILRENAAKSKAQHAFRVQRKATQEQAAHHRLRLARLRRKFARLSEESLKVASSFTLARAAQVQTRSNWSKIQRRRVQNLESVSAYTMELWARERAELFSERGVFGADVWAFKKGEYAEMYAQTDYSTADKAHGGSTYNPGVGDRPAQQGTLPEAASADGCAHSAQGKQHSAAGEVQAHSDHHDNHQHHVHDAFSHTSASRKRRVWWRLDFTEGPQRMRRRLEVDLGEMHRSRYEASPNIPGLFVPIRSAFVVPKTGAGSWETREDLLEPQAMTARCERENAFFFTLGGFDI
jgi:hypothetical protein